MNLDQFVKKWQDSSLKESASSQQHFLDLCSLVNHQTPAELDPKGNFFTFEKGITKQNSKNKGFADVWKKGHFAWEYKGKNGNLEKAYTQLLRYRTALHNPPLLIVSDMDVIRIHTNFTNTPEEIHEFDLGNFDLEKLRWIFWEPERFKPGITVEDITKEAAEKFANISRNLLDRGYHPDMVAHFLTKLIFCMFAEDARILPENILTNIVKNRADVANEMILDLLIKMHKGGIFGTVQIPWFNGGLFDDKISIPLTEEEMVTIRECCTLDWNHIEPSIFGTLFERGLDPSKRSQLGAHYTPAADIERIVNPVIVDPFLRDLETARKTKRGILRWLEEVRNFKVLDPACGSGNFLYVALRKLHDLEKQGLILLSDFEGGQLSSGVEVNPGQVRGIEINSYAAELARVTIWIGHLQWMIHNGFGYRTDPILDTLVNIWNMDALIDGDKKTVWPEADAIVGNPPFIGGSRIRTELGSDYVVNLRKLYPTPKAIDFVGYWFLKSAELIKEGKLKRVGLVSTNSIAEGANKEVLAEVLKKADIYNAYKDEPWVSEGASVRISLVCFAQKGLEKVLRLEDSEVNNINPDLTSGVDLSLVKRLKENQRVSCRGSLKNGPFDISRNQAKELLESYGNPNGRLNSDVIKPKLGGADLVGKNRDLWIIDFADMPLEEASMYTAPFKYLKKHVKPIRDFKNGKLKEFWWQFQTNVENKMFKDVIVTATTAKYRIFSLESTPVSLDDTIAIICGDITHLGVLHSRFHETWSLSLGGKMGKGNDPRYFPTKCFETFPFPEGLQPNLETLTNHHAQEIAEAAENLLTLRNNWKYPKELTRTEPEMVEGYPDRILPIDDKAKKILDKRTLTNLYNENPTWLQNAHRKIDVAVAKAYGVSPDLGEQEILQFLLDLNLERSKISS